MMDNAQKNRNFWKMGRNRRKVAIAKDVLLQLATGKMIAESGVYCKIKTITPTKTLDLQTELQNLESCNVCGIGAVFVSKVKLGNGYKIDDCELGQTKLLAVSNDIIKNMSRIFTETELRQIEAYFEGWVSRHCSYSFNSVYFRENNPDDKERLTLIMENIIQNKGELKPEQLV